MPSEDIWVASEDLIRHLTLLILDTQNEGAIISKIAIAAASRNWIFLQLPTEEFCQSRHHEHLIQSLGLINWIDKIYSLVCTLSTKEPGKAITRHFPLLNLEGVLPLTNTER